MLFVVGVLASTAISSAGRSQKRTGCLWTQRCKQCAEFASQTCAFLSGQKLEYSNRPAEHKDAIVMKVEMAPRPNTMFIMRTYTKKVRAVTANGRAMVQAGPWIGVREFGGS